MSKYDLPDLPSDEELGITEEDREAYEDAAPADRPEMSKEEMIALLGETLSPGAGSGDAGGKKGSRKEKKEKKEKAKKAKKKDKEAKAEGHGHPSSAAAAAEPRSRWRGPVTLALLVGVAVLSSSRATVPSPVPANAGDTVFSSARAMTTLIEIARRPHPTGSPEHTRVRGYLVDRLRALGLEPEIQTTTSAIQSPQVVQAATVRNVLARIPGTASTGAVLVTAHYDTRELAPGAGDDGTGLVAILEALRALRAGEALRNDLIVLFTDAEEAGLLGARAFASQHPWMRDVALVLSFEMRGGGGPAIMFETKGENGWVLRALQELDPAPLANSLAAEVYERMPNDTDFTPFKEAGKQGLNFAAIGEANVYHQSTDTPENLSEGTLQHHGVRALASMRHFGSADLSEVDAPDVVYFTLPFVGLVVYDDGWVLPITGGLVVLYLLAALLARRGGARIGAVVTGLGLAILGAALSYGAAVGLAGWVAGFHPEAGTLSGSLFHAEGWYVVALVAASFVIVTTLHALARTRLSPLELLLGAILLPLAGAVWASFAAPLAAMNLQWPVASALVAALVLALLGTRARGIAAWIAASLLAIPVLALFVPLVELVWMALTFQTIGLVAVLIAIALQLSLPALDSLRHPNAWWAPALGVAVGAATLALGVSGAEAGPERPAPSTLVYLYEHGTGSARWVTDPNADTALDAEAIAWAQDRAGASFSRTEDLRRFGIPWEEAPVAPAPVVNAPRPEIAILRDTVDAGQRRVTMAVRSSVGAERLTFVRDTVGRTRMLSVNGVTVAQPGSVDRIFHWGVPDTMVVLELDMPAEEPIGVHVVESLWRPEELLGAGTFRRPPQLAPDVQAMSDRAVLSTSVAAFADPRHAFVPATPEAEAEPAAGPSNEDDAPGLP